MRELVRRRELAHEVPGPKGSTFPIVCIDCGHEYEGSEKLARDVRLGHREAVCFECRWNRRRKQSREQVAS